MGNVTIHHPKVSQATGGATGVTGIPGILPNESAGQVLRNGALLFYSDIATMGISNTWSIAFNWSTNTVTGDVTLLDIGNTTDDTNRIRIDFMGTVASDTMRVLLYDSANTLFKQYEHASSAFDTADYTRWQHTVVTWDGTNLKLYMDGTLYVATTLTTDNAGTQTDTARRLSLGSTTAGGQILTGWHKHLMIWNSVLTANEVASLFAGGNFARMEPTAPYKDYNSQASLIHWWDCGGEYGLDSSTLKYADKVGSLRLGGAGTGTTVVTGNINATGTALGSYPGKSYIDLSVTRALAATAGLIGVANSWTLMGHTRRVSTTAATWTIATIANTSNNINTILVQVLGIINNEPWQISIYNSAGTLFKQYTYKLVDTHGDGLISVSWLFWAITWDGTNLELYRNGVRMTPTTKVTDNTGTMTDTSRQPTFSISKALSGVTYRCMASEYAMWDVALSGTEIERIWDGGNMAVDYAEDTQGYYSSNHLKHWWRIGTPPRSIGTTPAITGLVTDEVRTGGMDLSSLAVGSPTKTNVLIGKVFGGGGSLYCMSAQYPRSLSAPAGNKIGIANNFAIGYWQYTVLASGSGVEQTLVDIGAGGPNGIRIYADAAVTTIKLWDRDGVLFKHYTIANGWSAGSLWRWHVLTWDGTTLSHMLGTTLTTQTFTKTVDLAGIMEDTPRAISLCNAQDGLSPMFNAIISTIQVWNTTSYFFTANRHALLQSRNLKDLNKNFGLYTIGGNLQHWWRPGASPSQPGMDYANPATGQIPLKANYDQIAITQWGPT